MSRIQRLLAIFLSVIIFLGAFSVATPVFAENVTDAIEHYEFVQNAINNPAVAEQTTPEAEITFEVEEKRDEYTKVYKKDDGTYTAVMSAEPLHYLKDGEWEEINNSLLPNGDTYSNAENSFTVEVPENINSNENFTVEKDGYEISFSVEGISQSSAVVENNIVTSETQVPLADEAITQTQSSVTYSDIAENTALQYVVTPNSIKENIIVSSKESVKETYTFTFETNGLNVDKQDDGSVEFKSESGDVKFRIPRPVMTDSAQAFSYDIAVVLVYNTDGTVTLKYSPSQEWVNNTERVYPINIDPAIEVGDKDSTWVEDTYVLEDSQIDTSGDKYYNAAIGGVVNVIEENGRTRYSEVYTKLNMEKAKVLGDNVIFTEVQYLFLGYTTNGYAVAKKIKEDIDFKTVKGLQRLQLESEAIDYYTSPFTGYEGLPSTYMHFNITKPFNDWYRGEPNNGFAVVPGNEGFYSAVVLNGTSTSYYLNQMNRPYATIIVMDYVDMGGYNEKYEYHENSVSRAGKSYVNILTQQLTFMRDDVNVDYGTQSIAFGMIYDSATYDKIIALGYNSLLAYGNNWTPSALRAFVSVGENQLTYYSETGDAIDFVRTTDENGNIVYEEQYTDTYGSSGYELVQTNSNGYEIIRPDGNIEKFNELGLLISVTNSSNTVLYTVEYDSTGNRPSYRIEKITVGENTDLDYVYDDVSGLLSKITYQSSKNDSIKEINYEYYTCEAVEANTTCPEQCCCGNLKTVSSTDENGNTYECIHEYNGNGNITSVTYKHFDDNKDIDNGVRVLYTYEKKRVASVTVQEYDGTGFVGDETTTYERLNTTQVKVTDAQNNYKVYSFDIKGTHLYTYDSSIEKIVFKEAQNENVVPSIYNYSENYKLNNWQSSSDFVCSEENNEPVFEIQGGVEAETVLYQAINFIGDKGDEIVISGWVKGLFTKSQTDSTWLQEIIESDDELVLNFTNDRFAQVEISYQYQGTNEDGVKQTCDETVVIPFVENIDGWQLASERFILKGTCKSITACIRFSKNVNPVLISGFGLTINKQYQLFDDTNGSYSLRLENRVDAPVVLSFKINGFGQVTTMAYKNEVGEETNFVYEYVNGRIEGILVNNIMRHRYTYDQTSGYLKSITSADDRIVRYVDKDTPIPKFFNNPIYDNEDVVCDYIEEINGINYHTLIDRTVYEYDIDDLDFKKCLFKESSNVFSEYGKGIGVETIQDWYGRRKNDTIQLKSLDMEIGVESFAKLETVYGYGEEVSFETLNDIKTYTNTILTPNEQSALSGNNSFSYEYDENGNVVEEYAYISENSMELRYSYQYNDKNQLVRYNDNVSDPKRSYTYTYDDSGRVLSKSTYTYAPLGTELGEVISTENYEYNGNVLTEYGNNPVENNVSNYPTSYEGATLTWVNNQLISYTYTENDENSNPIVKRISYTYDENGYLSSKLIETKQEDGSFTQSEKYDYTWAYGKLINQVHTSYKNGAEIKTVIKFVYDSYNSVQGFIVNDTASYIYLKNLQGDIIGVVNEAGEVVASYSYDVWGKQTVTTTQNIVGLLPLAYRGYFLDNDIDLYFIDKRAYNPNWGKFLDSASTEAQGMPELAQYNMYTYWENNPVWYMTKEEKEAYKAKSIANYLHNKKTTEKILSVLKEQQGVENEIDLDTFIYNQNTNDINQYSCGVVTAKPKGCAWIATYNAAKMLGINLNPEDVIREYENMGMFLQGFFGVHPFAVAKFFTDRGYNVKVSFGDFENVADDYVVNIMYYNGTPVGHYAAIEYRNGEYWGYNVFGSSDIETLEQEITVPVNSANGKIGNYIGKVLISITPKEQATVNS